MGRFHRILDPGLNILVPVADKIKYVQSLKEIAIDVPKQSAITSDNVTLSIDGVLYLRIIDPYRGLPIIVKQKKQNVCLSNYLLILKLLMVLKIQNLP